MSNSPIMQQLSLPLNILNTQPKTTSQFQEILKTLNITKSPGWPDIFGELIHNWCAKKSYSPIKTLSLFTGGGGLDIAFHDCGFQIIKMVELEPKYIKTLETNSQPGKYLENSQPICINIRDYFPSPELEIDFIIGGPPCQTFSAAGRRASGVPGTKDTRGKLFLEYVRILKRLQPKGFLFENVYGIIGAENGKAWQTIQTAFQEAGYTIYYRILDAADYGVPQHRERLFIVGLKTGNYLFPAPTHGPDSIDKEPFYTALTAVKDINISEKKLEIKGKYGHLLTDIPPGLNYSFYTDKMGHPQPIFSWRSKFSDFLYKADPEMPVRTIKAQGGQYTGPFSWENRRFSIAELKRLQTFPDAYEIVGNRSISIEQIGNSVPPQLGRILALSILSQVMGVKLPFSMQYLSPTQKLGFRQRKRQLTKRYAEKASEAIAKLSTKSLEKLQTVSLSINSYPNQKNIEKFLSTDFGWHDLPKSNSVKIYLNYDLHSSYWLIDAGMSQLRDKKNQYSIDIIPSENFPDWVLNTERVKLIAYDWDLEIFTGLWKAFEEKLRQITGKADLVQLSGYYQYQPKIKITMNFSTELETNSIWQVVESIIRGVGVKTQLSAQQLAFLWRVNTEDIFQYLQCLRKIGYEVRNHNTNPQIIPGEYLIPYTFPTLNPQSVQLRKSLE
ncbi:MAG: DNA cytosine methyltransferase [Cyanobacteriota bacterium]|nr:DNA cytosine methyltransferase [Cyanobacteriota bacterium]